MVRNGNGTKWLWYEMAMVRNGYGTKMIFIMVRNGRYEMVMVRNDCNSHNSLGMRQHFNTQNRHGSIFIPDFPGFRYE